VDVLAYILQVLGHAAGDTELGTDSPAMKRSIEMQPRVAISPEGRGLPE
jgi:hypothetical protein